MSPNRIVAVLTPLVFAPLAGAIATWAANNAGIEVSEERLTAIFIGGALIALAPALQWLHGWQQFEAREADTQQAVELANAGAPALLTFEEREPAGVEEDEADEADDDEFDEFDEFDEMDDDTLLADEDEPAPTGS